VLCISAAYAAMRCPGVSQLYLDSAELMQDRAMECERKRKINNAFEW